MPSAAFHKELARTGQEFSLVVLQDCLRPRGVGESLDSFVARFKKIVHVYYTSSGELECSCPFHFKRACCKHEMRQRFLDGLPIPQKYLFELHNATEQHTTLKAVRKRASGAPLSKVPDGHIPVDMPRLTGHCRLPVCLS